MSCRCSFCARVRNHLAHREHAGIAVGLLCGAACVVQVVVQVGHLVLAAVRP